MPITGKFVADFASFQDAVQKATVSLTGMETGAEKVEGSLDRMVNRFSGKKIIQDAELMTQTFELLASKGIGLTNAELLRMGKVADEAIAKLKAGGETVPAGMQQIADAAAKIKPPLDNAQTSATTFFSTLKSAAGLVGIAFSAQAVIGFGKHVFDTASQIGDAADKLGVGAEALQRFQFAAEQSGATLGDVTTAIGFMNKTLAGGDASTKEALQAAGLAFQDIRNMRPDDAFKAIAEAIKGVKDPMEQARIVTELWGRSALDLLPAVKAGLKEVGDQTSTMSDETIKRLKAAQDAWSAFGTQVTTITGEAIGRIAQFVTDANKEWSRYMAGFPFAGQVGNRTDSPLPAFQNLPDMTGSIKEGMNVWGKMDIPHLAQEFDALGREIKNTGGALDLHTMSADALDGVYKSLDLDARIVARASQDNAAAQREATASTNELGASIIKAYSEATKIFLDFNKANLEAANNVARLGLNVKDFGREVTVNNGGLNTWLGLLRDGFVPVLNDVGLKVDDFGKKVQVHLPEYIVKQMEAEKKAEAFRQKLGDVSTALGQLGQIAGGSLGTVATSLGTLITAANTASTAIASIKTAMASTNLAETLVGWSTGIAGLATASIAAGKAIAGLFNRNKGRDAVVEFAESFGGFDALHAKLLEIDNDAAGLWVKLTQGVGSNNPEQAARVIAEVEAALSKQAAAQDSVTGATEEQAQATIETASQAAKALEELTPRLKANEDDWRSWGDVVTAQIQKIADGLRGLPLGGSSSSASMGGFQSKDYGPVMDASGRPVVFTSNLVVSGRTLATVNAEAALGW